MASFPVLQLVRRVEALPARPAEVRAFREEDLDGWLTLQNRVFRPGTRPWSRYDFQRQLVQRDDWDPENLLLISREVTSGGVGERPTILAAVYLTPPLHEPTVVMHWLAVAQDSRRQGLGSRLVAAALHRAADWQAEWLRAETLATWTDAVAFYRRLAFVVES